MGKGWLEGPLPHPGCGKLRVNGEELIVIPALRFGAQQADKLRTVGDVTRGSIDSAKGALSPIDLASI